MAQDEVLAAIEFGERVTTKIIEERTGIPKKQVANDLLRLSLYGLVEHVDNDDRWKIWERR